MEGGLTHDRMPLSGLRVLECGDTIASAYAGRLLADLGADVVLVEARHGHPLRAAGPYVGGAPHRDLAAGSAYFHAGKRSVALDLGTVETRATLASLLAAADVVIRSTTDGSDWIADAAISAAEQSDPGLVVVDVSTFGRVDAPHSPAEGPGHPTSDLLALAAGGLLSVNATRAGDPNATPLRYRGELATIHAGSDAVLTVLGALFERRRSGLGQRIDVSAEAAIAAIMATAIPSYSYAGEVAVHDGKRGVAPWGFYPCQDGHALVQITEDQQWRAFVKVLGDPEWGALEIFDTTAMRCDNADVLDPMISEITATFAVAEFLEACHQLGVAAARIHTAADIVGWEHLRVRDFFDRITVSDGRRAAEVLAPGIPYRYHRTAAVVRGPQPRLGEHTTDAVAQWSVGPADGADAHRPTAPVADDIRTGPTPRPLDGVKVLDLTWVWAGPYATLQLAHLGADVVKIETETRLDVTRLLGPWADEAPGRDRSGYFNQYNQGKQSITMDLKRPACMAVLRRLIAEADIVIDNMRPGALARMGLTYDVIHALNPRIVAVSMSGFGESGPERDRMAYGSLIDALSGVASANGAIGGGPTDFPMSLPDPCAGMHSAIATVAALYRAQRTGVGERVEAVMLDASIAAFPWPVLYQGVTGQAPPVQGNRDELRAPHDVYRCAGTYEWVAISCDSDAQVAALLGLVGRPDLIGDSRFTTLAARRLHADDLDEIISAWTIALDKWTAAARLRDAGVPAQAAAKIDEVFRSATLAARSFFTTSPHREVGTRQLAGAAWRTTRSPMVVTTAAPCFGEHTYDALRRWLGMPNDEIDALAARPGAEPQEET